MSQAANGDACPDESWWLHAAQSTDNAAGVLNTQGDAGGPLALSRQPFYFDINDVLSPGFDPRAFRAGAVLSQRIRGDAG